MEKITEHKRKESFQNSSKNTALQFQDLFPQAQLYPFGPDNNVCHWSWEKLGGCKDVAGYEKPCFWGLLMSSVPLVVLDFDIKTKDKKVGMTQKSFETLKREFDLLNYPYFTKSRSGFGGHAWFSDKGAPKTETEMDFITGLDYKVNTMIFLTQFPFSLGIDDLRELPQKFLDYDKRPKKKKKGRFHTQQRDSWSAKNSGNISGIFEAYHEARKAGQTLSEAMSVAKPTLEKMDFIPDPTPPKERSKGKTYLPKVVFKKDKKARMTNTILPTKKVQTITDLGFPTGSITVFGGGQGEGKTTTILKSGAKNSSRGDKRPTAIFTRENSINNLILPWWEQFGGEKGKLYYPEHDDFPKPEMVSWEIARPFFLELCNSGEFALVFIDLVYLMVKNELDNKEYEKAFLEIQNHLHHSTAFVCTAHLKKDVKDQPLLHHFRGGTDLTGIPDRVMYLRRGQNKSERVIVKLKDRSTGDLSGGFLTSMANANSEITIKTLSGSPKSILKQHAEALVIDKPTEGSEDFIVETIRRKVKSYSERGGMWATEDYIKWAKDILGIGDKKARTLLRKAGFRSRTDTKQGKWKIWSL